MRQETLEEASERLCPNSSWKHGFIAGAKWQTEQDKNKYSEEEVGELIHNVIGQYGKHYGIMIDGAKLNELFEQFKNK